MENNHYTLDLCVGTVFGHDGGVLDPRPGPGGHWPRPALHHDVDLPGRGRGLSLSLSGLALEALEGWEAPPLLPLSDDLHLNHLDRGRSGTTGLQQVRALQTVQGSPQDLFNLQMPTVFHVSPALPDDLKNLLLS